MEYAVEYNLQKSKGFTAVKHRNSGGTYVERDGVIYQLQEHPIDKNPELFNHNGLPNFINYIEATEDASHTEATEDASQTETTEDASHAEATEDASHTEATEDASQTETTEDASHTEFNDAIVTIKPSEFYNPDKSPLFTTKLNYIPDTWRPAGCLPKDIRFVFRSSALNDYLEENHFGEAVKKLTRVKKEQPYEEKIKKDTTKLKKQNIAKKLNKGGKETNLSIIDGDDESLKPAKDDELPLKREAVSETGYLRLKQIIGDSKSGIPAIIPVSRATWYAGVKSGRYPKQVKLSGRTVGWKKSEIMALQEELEKGEKW